MSEKEIRATIASLCEQLDQRRIRKLGRLLLPAVAAFALGTSPTEVSADAGNGGKPADASVDAGPDGGSVDAGEAVAMYSAPGCGV